MAAATANNGGAAKVATEFEKIIHAGTLGSNPPALLHTISPRDHKH